jgi:hypothetical protein
MTAEQLIDEGRKLQRPTHLLKPTRAGEPVAVWFEADPDDESVTGWRRWMTVRADAIPNSRAPESVFFSLYTNGVNKGLIDFVEAWPPTNGIQLYAHPVSILPPIEAVFAHGSAEIGSWLAAHGWKRNERYNSNFPDAGLVHAYEKIWFAEHPIYKNHSEIYATTGGWHFPGQDSDWHDLISAKLILTTFRDSEPWVEVFQLSNGDYKVIQRIA